MVEWGAGANPAAQTVAGNTKVLLQSFTAAVLEDAAPGTIVRVRGTVMINTDQSAATEAQIGAFGMAVVTEQARVAGAASLPGPVTNAAGDHWFVWTPILSNFRLGSDIGFQESSAQHSIGFDIDSKAMRKFAVNDAIVIMVENIAASGFSITNFFRILFKLH